MIIDAMHLLHLNHAIDGFCLVSSDSDFTWLAQRLREAGKHVIGFGEQKTCEPFVAACERFIYVENLKNDVDQRSLDDSSLVNAPSASSRRVVLDEKTRRFLRDAVKASACDNGWAYLGEVGQLISYLRSDFDTRTYGFKRLGPLLKAQSEVFDCRVVTSSFYVRLKVKK